MKKKLLAAVFAASVLISLALTSCNKAKDTSRPGLLVGDWKVMEQGMDDNGNGTWDLDEHFPTVEGYETTIAFKADGTGLTTSYLGAVITIPFSWQLVNGENDIRIICDYAGSVDTSYENIVSFSASEVVTKTSNDVTTNYNTLRKQ
jgi:hypothetical protein